jgi:hypothetical protein
MQKIAESAAKQDSDGANVIFTDLLENAASL